MKPATATLLALILVAGGLAAAAEADPHLQAGIKAFGAEEYLKATEELGASLAQAPTAKAALYLGNAYLKLGQLARAKEALQRALQIDPKSPKRDSIRKLIANIDSRIVGVVKIASTPPGATIYLEARDKGARGRTPLELSLAPGTYQVLAELDGFEAASHEVQVASGEAVNVDLAMRAVAPPAPVAAAAPVAAPAPVAQPAPAAVAQPAQAPVAQAAAAPVAQAAAAPVTQPAPALEPPSGDSELTLTVEPPETVVLLDGAQVFAGSPTPLMHGDHRLELTADGHRSIERRIAVAEGDRLLVDARLAARSGTALGLAITATALAVAAETLALVERSFAGREIAGTPTYQDHRNAEVALHITAGVLAAAAVVGFGLEFGLNRPSFDTRSERKPRLGAIVTPQGGALTLMGRF